MPVPTSPPRSGWRGIRARRQRESTTGGRGGEEDGDWLFLQEAPPASALARFSSALRRFAARLGKADRYHETITWAYLLLINERMERTGRGKNWPEFAEANADLLTWRETVLRGYYREETLRSDLARRVFLLPDRLQS